MGSYEHVAGIDRQQPTADHYRRAHHCWKDGKTMKLAAILLILARIVGAQIAFVNSVSNGCASQPCTAPSSGAVDMHTANLLGMCINNGSTGAIAISDSSGNTWTQVEQTYGGSQGIYAAYVANPTVTSTMTFTVGSGAVNESFVVMGFSGAATSSPLDATAGTVKNSAGAGTTIQAGSITPSANGEVVITCAGNFPATDSVLSVNSSFTAVTVPGVNGSYYSTGMAQLVQTSAAATNPTWTMNAGTGFSGAINWAFRAGASGPPQILTGKLSVAGKTIKQ
jgi:hypothetical protein